MQTRKLPGIYRGHISAEVDSGEVCLRLIENGATKLIAFPSIREAAHAAFNILTSEDANAVHSIQHGTEIIWRNQGLSSSARLLRLM